VFDRAHILLEFDSLILSGPGIPSMSFDPYGALLAQVLLQGGHKLYIC
jgi:hypothetical protein